MLGFWVKRRANIVSLNSFFVWNVFKKRQELLNMII